MNGPKMNSIDIKESKDVNYWCNELNLRAEELKEIVKLVGPAVYDVRLYLAKKYLINWPLHLKSRGSEPSGTY